MGKEGEKGGQAPVGGGGWGKGGMELERPQRRQRIMGRCRLSRMLLLGPEPLPQSPFSLEHPRMEAFSPAARLPAGPQEWAPPPPLFDSPLHFSSQANLASLATIASGWSGYMRRGKRAFRLADLNVSAVGGCQMSGRRKSRREGKWRKM
jgi:hypothetical protein